MQSTTICSLLLDQLHDIVEDTLFSTTHCSTVVFTWGVHVSNEACCLLYNPFLLDKVQKIQFEHQSQLSFSHCRSSYSLTSSTVSSLLSESVQPRHCSRQTHACNGTVYNFSNVTEERKWVQVCTSV